MTDAPAPRMTSHRPYLLRALYEWIADNDMTPHLLVDATRPGVRVPPHTVKDGATTDFIDHPARFLLIEGSHAKGDIVQDLDQNAAQAEHNDRTEQGIVDHAQHGFNATFDHGRDQHGDLLHFGVGGTRALHQQVMGFRRRFGG